MTPRHILATTAAAVVLALGVWLVVHVASVTGVGM